MDLTKKITLATVKQFIKKYGANLYIKHDSYFVGMTEGITAGKKPKFEQVVLTEKDNERNLGIEGAFFVRSSRDYLTKYDNFGGDFTGIQISNSCGRFVLAIQKTQTPEITKAYISHEPQRALIFPKTGLYPMLFLEWVNQIAMGGAPIASIQDNTDTQTFIVRFKATGPFYKNACDYLNNNA